MTHYYGPASESTESWVLWALLLTFMIILFIIGIVYTIRIFKYGYSEISRHLAIITMIAGFIWPPFWVAPALFVTTSGKKH